MTTKKINRLTHAGKSWGEKEAYRKFLTSEFYLDKTQSAPVDINKTSESSFEEEKIEPIKIQKKSKRLKIKDFFNDNWVIAVFSGVVILTIGGYIAMNREQGVQGQKIRGLVICYLKSFDRFNC